MEAQTCKKELWIEIPVEAVRKQAETVTAEFARAARIPGFRPGHAPSSLIRTRYRDDIKSEVVQALVPRFFKTAVEEQKFAVVGQPQFEDLKFDPDQPLKVKATFEVYPSFELKEYKGLEAEEDPGAVTEAEIKEALDALREEAAMFEPVVDRPAQEGDFLDVSYTGRNTQEPANYPIESRQAMVHLGGEGTVSGFTENLKGAKAGETREFEVAYPQDYAQKNLAGKRYRYRVEVRSIKNKVMPALDDDLAKSVSELGTLEELRSKVVEDLKQMHRRRAEAASKEKLMEKLMAGHEFPIPDFMVEAQLDQRLEKTLTQLVAQGVDIKNMQVDWRKVREESRPAAAREVRGALILEKIAEAEKIEISEEEVDEAIREMSKGRSESAAALKTRLTRDGMLDRIQSSRRNQKALDFVYHNAKISRKSE